MHATMHDDLIVSERRILHILDRLFWGMIAVAAATLAVGTALLSADAIDASLVIWFSAVMSLFLPATPLAQAFIRKRIQSTDLPTALPLPA